MREHIRIGALHGSYVWATYGVLEILFLAVLPWFVEPHVSYTAYHAGFASMFVAAYAIVGALIGVLCSTMAPRSDAIRRTSILILLLAIQFNSLAPEHESWKHFLLPKALALLLASGLVLSLRFPRLLLLTNPLVAFSLYLAPPWLDDTLSDRGIYSPPVRLLAMAVVVVVIVALGELSRRLGGTQAAPRRELAAFGVLAVITLGLVVVFKPEPLRQVVRSAANPGQKPNVLLIVLDTVRADHLSAYGYERRTTPFLEKFSHEATLYTRSFSAGDMTLPSHASMFTGVYPTRHDAHFRPDEPAGRPLSAQAETLAEFLAGKGFRTSAVVANAGYVTDFFGLHQGFEFFDPSRRRATVGVLASNRYLRRATDGLITFLPDHLGTSIRSSEDINRAVFAQLESLVNTHERPFFLFVNYMDAHQPCYAPEAIQRDFGVKGRPFSGGELFALKKDVLRREREFTAAERDRVVPRYDAAIAWLDRQIGELISHLRARGVYDNSLIIITSDHGEAFGEKGTADHGGMSVYQNQVFVPLLIKYPKSNAPAVVETPVSNVDIFPTVADVLGYEAPGRLDGRSLLRLGDEPNRGVLAESYPDGGAGALNPRFNAIRRAIIVSDQKLIVSSDGPRELYDLKTDPNETRNLYRERTALAKELELKLVAWSSSVTPKGAIEPVRLDRETLNRLRSLGYVGGK